MAVTKKEIRIWTRAYQPMRMGGDVHAPVATTVEALGPFDLGRGLEGYLATDPQGRTAVAEAETGALIGPTIEAVAEDVSTADPKIVDDQMAWARNMAARAEDVPPEEFWSRRKS